MTVDYITDAVRGIVGARSDWIAAGHPVEGSELRRSHQTTMDPARRHWDKAFAEASRYRSIVAPPAFAVHAFRRPAVSLERGIACRRSRGTADAIRAGSEHEDRQCSRPEDSRKLARADEVIG